MARNASANSLRRKPSIGRLLAGISSGAASLALASVPASVHAQAVQGTATVQFGANAPTYNSATKTDTIFVTSSEALVDWAITSPTGEFLPEGSTLRFNADTGSPFTVLNRVTDVATSGPLSISGTVSSVPQGRIWFYNAGGWVVGPTGVFNVGSLVLTSLPITIDPASDTVSRLYGDKNEIRFGKALDPKSSVTIQSGALINAAQAFPASAPTSSYVAVVAPRVVQGGAVTVNGSAAYVAAEAATMTINTGLFDIIVDSGSDDAEGVVHTGTTKWPATAGATDANHRVYLVAVPKNQAMTAVVAGSLGYDGATTASVVDGSIVLSAGYNVVGGNVDSTNVVGGDSSLAISRLTVGQKGATTNLTGYASGDVTIDARGSSTSVRGSADIVARGNISANIDKTNSLVVDSGLSLGSTNGARAGNVSVSVAGGGLLNVGGTLDLSSIATGAIQTDPSNGDALLAGSIGEDAVSGNVGLTVTDGNVNTGSTTLSSLATSGVGELSAGSATSGNVSVIITQTAGATSLFGGSLGDVALYTNAENGTFGLQSPIKGGDAVSGAATLAVNGGTFDSSSIALGSDAVSVAGSKALPLNATAGKVSISFANGNGTVSTGGIDAGNYASASDGGTATLGDVSLAYDNVQSFTSVSVGSIDLHSYAYGNLAAPNTLSLSLSGNARLDTNESAVSLFTEGRNASGTQLAGNVAFVGDAGTLIASRLDMTSQALANNSGVDAVGGNVSATLRNGADLMLIELASLVSRGRGGSGADGGNGTGGDVSFTLADSSYSGSLNLLSNGVAGRRNDAAGRSGTGLGGTVNFSQTGKTASLFVDTMTLTSLGQGGRPDSSARTGLVAQAGDGAAGIGGDVTFSVADGTFSASSLTVAANGEGANAQNVAGFAPGTGGSGTGGTATLSVTGGLMTVSTVDVAASGFGGDGAQSSDALGIVGGTGGAGTGGSATASFTGGALRTEALTIEANGNKSITGPSGTSYFGNGGNDFSGNGAGGDGGLGTGGQALLTIDGGALSAISFSSASFPVTATVNAIGEGGAGGYTFTSSGGAGNRSGSGGNGQGGTADIRFLSGTFDAETIRLDATGFGGLAGNDAATVGEFALNAGKGGDGSGGTSTFEIASDFASTTLSGATRSVDVRADGIGVAGESGLIGGAGGSGLGGTARILANGGVSSLAAPVLSAAGLGKAGGNSTDGYIGGAGGSGSGGQALITVTGDGTKLSVGDASLLVSGMGGVGGRGGQGSDSVDEAGDGGAGGAGTGGAIGLDASNLGQLVVTGARGSLIAANGFGGEGGLGGNAAFNGWRTLGNGGAGGAGSGGTFDALAQSGGVVTFDDLSVTVNGLGGAGGSYAYLDVSGTLDQSVGGAGGVGSGGSASFQSVGLNSRLEAPSLVVNANGLGGAGVDGSGYAVDGSSANGSAGGSAIGGNILVLADADGAIALATSDGNVALSANGTGGNGGRAFAAITAAGGIGGNGGSGGDSGSGTGGTIAVSALSDGTASLGLLGTVTLSANGTGGLAGLGGDGASSTAPVTLGGSGGNNGLANAGSGGAVSIASTGGTARFGALLANATGETFDRQFAGAGGSGTSGPGLPGSSAFVTPSGGTVSFSSADAGAGITGSLVADATTVDVTSRRTFPLAGGAFINELAGTISLSSSSTAAVDGMRFASFSGDARGSLAGFAGPAISLTALSGPIAFDTDLILLSAGSIALSMANGASVSAGGIAHLVSDTGIDIAATGAGRFNANSILLESFGDIGISLTACATATCRPIEATTSLTADASGDFSISGPAIVAGLGSLDVYAFGNVTGSANSGFVSNGSLRVRAGQNATVRNATGASLDIEAGAVPDGTTLYYDGLLTLGQAGGGGVFSATGNIVLASGGGIAVTGGNSFSAGSGIDVRSGNDIVVGQNNSFVANTSAAVPGLPVNFAAGGLTLQYSLAPEDIAVLAFGSGTTVSAGTGAITLSGAAIDARLASFTGASFRADVLQTLSLTSTRRTNGERLDPACLEGAICIGDVNVTGTVRIGNTDTVPLDIRAVGRIAGSDVRLLATGDVTLQGVGRVSQIVSTGNLSIRSISREIALLGGAVVDGGTVRLAAGTNISGTGNVTAKIDDIGLFAGGDIDAASLTAARELTTDLAAGGAGEGAFTTSGALRVGTLSLGANANITAGKSIEIGALSLGGFDGTLNAGTLIDLGSTSAVNNLSLTAGTSVGFSTFSVDGNLAISGPSVTGTSAQAGGTLSINGDDLTANLQQAAGDLTLTITNSADLGTVSSTGGSVFIDPATLTFNAITSASAISLAGGTITGGTLDAGTSIDVTATGALKLTSANAGTTLSLGADSLQAGALGAGTDLALTIAKGAVLTGAATAGGGLSASFGTLDFTTLGASGLVSLAGTDLTGNGITAGTSLTALLTGDYAVSTASAGTSLALQAATATATSLTAGANLDATITGLADLADVSALGDLTISAGSLLSNSLTAGSLADISVSGTATVDATTAGTTLTFAAGTLNAGSFDAGSALSLTITGVATITGTAKAGTEASLKAASLSGGSFVAKGDLGISTTGNAAFVDASAGAGLTLSGANVSFNTAAGKTVGITLANLVGNSIALTETLSIKATGGITLGLIGPTAGAVDITGAALSLDLVSSGDLGVAITGNARLGAVLGSGKVILSAANLLVDNLSAAGVASLSGSTIEAGTLLSDSDLTISATGNVTIDRAEAGGTMGVSAASLGANTLQSAGDLTLTVTNSAALGTVTSTGGSVFIDPASLTFNTISSASATSLAGGTITGGSLDAGTSIDVTATGVLTLTSANAGSTLSLSADILQAGALGAGTDLALTIAKGAVLTGAATAGGSLTTSFGTLDFTTLGATGLVSLEGGDLTGNGITAGTSLTALLTGDYAVGTANAGTSLALQAASASGTSLAALGNLDATVTGLASVTSYSAGGDLTITAGTLDASTITADGLINGNVTGTATLGSANAGTTLAFTSGSLSATSLTSVGNLTLTVTDTAALGTVTSTGGAVFIDPALLTFDTITASGDITLAGGTITGGTLDAGAAIAATATAGLTLTSAISGTTLSLAGVDIDVGRVSAGTDLALTATNSINVTTSASAVGDMTLTAPDIAFKLIDRGTVSMTGGSVTGGDFSGDSLAVDITGTLTLGDAVGDRFDLKAGDIVANSIQGLTSGLGFDVALAATGGITVGSVSSGNDLRISSVTLDATTLDAVRSISVNTSGRATIGGAISSLVGITAGNLGLNLVDAKDVTINVTGRATLGTINALTGTIAITAGALSFDSVQSLTTASLTAGSITGTTVGVGTVLTVRSAGAVALAEVAAGSLDLRAGDLQIDNLSTTGLASLQASRAANILTANVGSLDYRAASARFDAIATTGAASIIGASVIGNTLNAGTDLSITATDLNAGALAANGNITLAVTNSAALSTATSSGGSIFIDPALLTFGVLSASGDIVLSGGTITGGSLDAGASIGVSATGALTLTSARAGTTLSLTANSLQAGALDAGTDLTLSTTGALSLTDIANAGGAVRATFSTFDFVGLNVGGLLDLTGTDLVETNLGGTIISVGGDANIALTGRYAVTGLTVNGNLLFGAQTASGAAIDVIGNADMTVAGLSSLSAYFAGGTLALTAGELSALSLSGRNVDARIAGAATFDSGSAGADFTLTAGSLDARTFLANGNLSLTTTGALNISGDTNAGGNISIASADLDVFSLAADGSIDLNVVSNAAVQFAVAGQLLNVAAGGLSLSSLSGADIQIDAGSISGAGGLSATNSLNVTSTGLVDLGAALAGGSLAITSRSLAASTIQSRGGNVSLSITGLAAIGDISALAGEISAAAGRLNFGSASASGQVQLGGVVIGGGVVNAGTSVVVSATNSMILDTVTAGISVDLNGGDINVNAVNAGTFADYTGRDVRVGTTDAGTTSVVVARNFAFDTLAATGSVGIRTSLDIIGGSIDAGTTLDVNAAGAVTLDVARTGGSIRARFATLGFNLLDSGGLLDLAGTDLVGTSIVTGGGANIALTGNYGVGSITGIGDLALAAQSASSSVINMGGNVALTVVDTAALGSVTSRNGAVTIDPALLTFDAITAAGDITLSGGTITGGTLDAGAAIGVTASDALTLASANAGTTLRLAADSLQSGALDAGDNLTLTVANGAVLTGTATAGGDFSSTAGSLGFATINAGAAAIFGGGSINGALVDAKGAISASLSGSATLGSAKSGTTLGIGAGSISADTLNAGTDLSLFANDAMVLDTAIAAGGAALNAASIQFESLASTGLAAFVGGAVSGGTLIGSGGIDIGVTGAVTLGSATSGAGLSIDAASLAATSLVATGDARLTTTGNLDLGTTQAGGSLYAQGLDLTFLALTGQTVELATRSIIGGTIDARSTLLVQADGAVSLDRAQAGSTAEFYVGSLAVPELVAGDLALGITGAARLGTVEASGIANISAATLDFASINAGGPASLSAGRITGGSIFGRFGVSLSSSGAIAISSARAFGPLGVNGASVTANSLSSDDTLSVQSTGDVAVAALYGAFGAAVKGSGITFATLSSDAGVGLTATSVNGGRIDTAGSVSVLATGGVTLDAVDAGFDVEITAKALDLPSLRAGRDVNLAISDTAALGAVTSAGGSITVDPALLMFDSIVSANAISLSGGTITGGTLVAGTNIDVSAAGTLTLDSADSGTTLSLSGANVQVGSLRSGGATSLTAGDLVSIASAINTGGDISITAARFAAPLLQSNSGNITLAISGRADLTNIAALAGDLVINAGTLRFTSASALGAVRLSGVDIAGTTVASGTSTSIGTTSVAIIDTVTAGSSAILTGPNVTVAKVTAETFTDYDGTVVNVGNTAAGTTAFVDVRDFTFDKLAAGQSVEILTTGNAIGGTIDAGTTLKITSSGDLKLDDAKAGGAITIEVANIDALTINGGAGLSLTATNAINLGTVKVLGAFDLSGASLVLDTSNSGLDSTFSLTGEAAIGSVTAGLAITGQNLVQVVVQALANSYTGGTLLPVFDVVQGQTITVSSSTNDLWSAGALPRFSDGNGLVVFRLATAQDDSGFQPGTQIGAAFGNLGIGNFSAPFGALVGQIGSQTVLLGANGTVTAPATGTLSVGYWDSNAGDNTGSIAFTFGTGTAGTSVSNPANVSVTTGGNLTVGSVNASRAVTLDAGAALKIETADAGTALSLTGNTIDAGTLKAGSDITLASTGASVIGSATAGGGFSASTGGLDFTLIDAAGAVDIASLAGVRGGNIIAGTSIVIEADGSIVIANGTAGSNIALTSRASGNVTTGALAAGGAIGIDAADVSLTSATAGGNFNASVRSLASPTISAGGAFTVSGTGTVELGTATAGSALAITSQTITFNRLTSAGTIDLAASGNVSGGDAVATGRIGVNAGGRFAYGALDGGAIGIVSRSVAGGALRARTGDINFFASGDAAIGAVNAAGYVGIDADLLDFSTITAGGSFGTTNERMTGTSISAGQDITISSDDDVSLSGLSGREALVRSNGVVNITGVQLSGAISVSADAVGLDATNNLAIRRIFASKGNVDVSAGGSIDANTIYALGDIDLLARDGDVTVSHLSAGYSDVFGGAVRPQGQVSGAVGQGNIDIVASDNIVINDVADAAKLFTMTAGDTIRLNGLATGAQMDLSSVDLAIGANGRLGETAHTSAIILRNTGQGVTLLGDNIPSTAGGYAISQAEFARIRSRGDLTIRGTRPMLVGDLAVVAQAGTVQGQIGETGTLSLRSTGLISFLGALSMSNAAGNTMSVSSGGDGIFLDAQTGSIRLLEGETRGGSLILSGRGIAMVTRTALEDIAQLTDTALITDRLGLNDGVTDGRTLVEADAITLRSDKQVYIQNTSLGTRLDDRRGLVANSLKIGSREGGVLDIVINGIVNGQTGVDAIEQITFEEAFTDLSSVNGCVILNANSCNKLPFEIIELRDLVEEVLKSDPADSALQVTDSFTKTTLIQLNQIAPAGFEPLIDEPVTGTGNDDLLGQGKQGGE